MRYINALIVRFFFAFKRAAILSVARNAKASLNRGNNMVRMFREQSGVVFITVTVIIMVLMVLTVSIMSLNLSQATISEDEVRQVQAEMLAYGGLSYVLAQGASQQTLTPDLYPLPPESVGGHTFTVTPSLSGSLPNQVLDVSVSY
jgi:hypothetical protein